MPKPSEQQLEKINKFTQQPLDADQVYVFRSLSADTLPVKRYSWFGQYDINFTSKMLNDLRSSYREGVGLLASHANNRLPFGRTYDAEVVVDYVDDTPVETLYIDHYIVTHMKDGDERVPLRTEVGGMTTQDIVNHIETGHTFDTSIGFVINKPLCSICKNDIRDHEKCSHLPGKYYDVQDGDEVVKQRCDILADGGVGLENSLVYAGAVDRATIRNDQFSHGDGKVEGLQEGVNQPDVNLYNVEELKKLPLNAEIYCRLSKSNLEIYTTTTERVEYNQEVREEMGANVRDTVSKEEYNQVISEKENLSTKVSGLEEELGKLQQKVSEMEDELAAKDATIESLTHKSELADQFTDDLINETVKAGVQARGNSFNKERYEKYLRSLEVDEIKEELQSFRNEFPGTVEEARVTRQELEPERSEETVELTNVEMRQLAAKKAAERYQTEGGDLEKLTKEELSKLKSQSK